MVQVIALPLYVSENAQVALVKVPVRVIVAGVAQPIIQSGR